MKRVKMTEAGFKITDYYLQVLHKDSLGFDEVRAHMGAQFS